jgi:anti-sigma B factor antagonist
MVLKGKMMSKLTLSDLKSIQLFEVVGRLDASNITTLLDAINEAIVRGRNRLILDLSGVEYMNSASLRELVLIYERIKKKGISLQIANPSQRVKDVLELVGLDSVLEIDSDLSLEVLRLTHPSRLAAHHQICYCT